MSFFNSGPKEVLPDRTTFYDAVFRPMTDGRAHLQWEKVTGEILATVSLMATHFVSNPLSPTSKGGNKGMKNPAL